MTLQTVDVGDALKEGVPAPEGGFVPLPGHFVRQREQVALLAFTFGQSCVGQLAVP